MRVVFINSVCNGSTGHIVQNLARELIEQGDMCAIAYGRGNAAKDFETFKIGNKVSVRYHGVMSRLFDSQGLHSKKATKDLIIWLSEYKPDLVWLHNIHGYYLNYKILFDYLKDSGVHIKWTLHDCWSFTGHCAYFDFAGCSKWKTGCKKCPSKKDYPKSYCDNSKRNYELKKKTFNSLDKEQLTLITPSKWLADLVKESFLSKYNVEVVNNKVDIDVFKPTPSNIKEKYGIADKKVILGVASVWDRRKGLDDFIELSRIIPDEYKIVLIGLKKEQISKLPKKILGLVRTENQLELVQWYSAAHCFFNPTYEDNYPTVLLEANACGCKTISYDTGGCKEISGYTIFKKGLEEMLRLLYELG